MQKIYSVDINKNYISMNYWSSTNKWKPRRWVRLDQTLKTSDIYISGNLNSLTKFTTYNRSTRLLSSKDVFPRNNSQMITKNVQIRMRIVNVPFWVWLKVNENQDNNMIRISQRREGHVEKRLASEDRNKSKRTRLCESHSQGVWWIFNHLIRVIWDKVITFE